MKQLNEYLEKARSLSDTKKIVIIAVIVLLLGSVMTFFWINSTKQRIKKIGESIKEMNSSLGSLPGIMETVSPSDQQITK